MPQPHETVLEAAIRIGGYITTPVVEVLLPELPAPDRRKILSDLCRDGALRPVIARGVHGVLYVTTRGKGNGFNSQLTREQRKRSSEAFMAHLREPRRPIDRIHITPIPGTIHNLIAARVTIGLRPRSWAIANDLQVWKNRSIPDGIAHLPDGSTLWVEVEMMINQSTNRWERGNGLAQKITRACYGAKARERTWVVAVTPRQVGKEGNAEEWLQTYLRDMTAVKDYAPQAVTGWYWLDLDNPDGPLVWHGLSKRGKDLISKRLPPGPAPLDLPGVAAELKKIAQATRGDRIARHKFQPPHAHRKRESRN